MVVLRIDDVACVLRDERVVLPRFSARAFESVDAWRESAEVSVEVEATPEVVRLLCNAENLHRMEDFNTSRHCGVIEVDGVPIFDGEATVRGVERVGSVVYYRITVRAEGHEWAHNAALTRLRDSDLDVSMQMTIRDVEESWSDGHAVRMLPLRRDSYPEPEETGLYTAQHQLMPHDYYPFISVRDVVLATLESGGYRLQSKFFGTDICKRLMMSGAYKYVDVSLLTTTMGFKALRSTSTSSTAGEDGRVYAWLPIIASNVGALVDTVDPTTVDENGRTLQDAYSNGGCFTFDEGRPIYKPKREINVAFDMHLHYTTEYRIASSRHLAGFTQLHLGNGCNIEVVLHNPFVDMRNAVTTNMLFKLFIFDYNPEWSYKLDGYGEVGAKISSIMFNDANGGATKLWVKRTAIGKYEEYDGDWALYEGYVAESGTREVVIDVRTPFERLTPSNPKRFQDICFGGAIMGQRLTLHAGCSIEPVFGGAMGYGQMVEFADVANVDISQSQLIEALRHMFNLRIYSHAPSKTLFMEPYDDFYGGGVVDWRDSQVGDSELITERASEGFMTTVLGYQPTDGAAARFTDGQEGGLGTWEYHVGNYAAKRSVEQRINPLFSPTASFDGASSSAASAQVLTVGDRDLMPEEGYVEPRVVVYHGIVPLPEGEYWPSPSGEEGYPLAAFHSAERGVSLCFEDRDGCTGLHSYYDAELRERAERQRLECDIRITPLEYASLFDPYASGATLRSIFRLDACGQNALFRLDAIDSYNPVTHVAHCVFVRRMND